MKTKSIDSNNAVGKARSEKVISDTIIVATVPFIAYAIVFSYELGYFLVFKIPLEFISFDLTSMFLVLTSIMIIFVTAYLPLSPILWIVSRQPKPIKIRLYILFLYTMLFVIYLLLYFNVKDIFKNAWLFGVISLAFGVWHFLWPLYTQRNNKKGYIAKLKAEDRKIKNGKSPSPLFDAIIYMIGLRPFIVLSIAVIFILVAFDIGRSSALQQNNFRIMNTSPERVALWTTNDKVVSVLFDRTKKQIDSSFVIIILGENPGFEYHLEKIGPLRVSDLAKNTTP